MIEKNMHPEKPMPEEERDLLGEIFSFRNVLLCAIVLGVLLESLISSRNKER